jgi:hypothetical protein
MDITTILSASTEIRVHLSHDALIACELKRVWGRSTVARKARFEFEAGDRADAMDALARWIATAPARRSIVWIVGPAEAQYFVLPWSPAYADRILRDAYARERFEQLFAPGAPQPPARRAHRGEAAQRHVHVARRSPWRDTFLFERACT